MALFATVIPRLAHTSLTNSVCALRTPTVKSPNWRVFCIRGKRQVAVHITHPGTG
ncbi:hypothetical protein CCACVL1_15568 [Corchorus capsularis]|uniref:Uncharacterized protein n=1 Tax=Corchorus capsularis TaxID=210143 RepID=A0A1R3I1W5_COCAP|nr:hypothetical protein CCACVL1_15568 [Corchorus capsularis]